MVAQAAYSDNMKKYIIIEGRTWTGPEIVPNLLRTNGRGGQI